MIERLVLVGAACGVFCFAQFPSPSSAGTNAGQPALPVQKIGPEDLLGISVYDAPELTRPARVTSDGFIHLPMLAPVNAAGLLPSELESSIAAALRAQNVMVNPIVTVTILEYQSHPINVAGAVKAPLTFQAYGRVTLLDALARAGGVTDNAGPDALVSRFPEDPQAGRQVSVQRIPLKELMSGSSKYNILLSGGEEIRVPEAEKIYVVGSVRKPGAFVVHDRSNPSVLKMLALSEGLLPYHQKMAYIYRDDADSDGKEEVRIELSKIMQRKAPDVSLMPNDVLYIPENGVRHSWATAMDRILSVGGAGLGTALIVK
jgi:polysaccharide export outer membrane protein